jgi:hypothetical protein
MAAHVPPHIDAHLLGLYLSDHLTGATGGSDRIQRMARAYSDTAMGPELAALADEITAAREALRAIIEALDLRQRPYRQAAAWLAERVGRLKLNGRLLTRSPLSPLLEVEIMRAAVNGQAGLWETLAELAPELGLPPERFAELAERSTGFSARFERLHQMARGEAFRAGAEVGAQQPA